MIADLKINQIAKDVNDSKKKTYGRQICSNDTSVCVGVGVFVGVHMTHYNKNNHSISLAI